MTDSPPLAHPQCCDQWPKIRPHLRWFLMGNEEETDLLVAPTIGPARAGAVRCDHCPSCGSPTRAFTWSLKELQEVEG